jgi:hypothetical protein
MVAGAWKADMVVLFVMCCCCVGVGVGVAIRFLVDYGPFLDLGFLER